VKGRRRDSWWRWATTLRAPWSAGPGLVRSPGPSRGGTGPQAGTGDGPDGSEPDDRFLLVRAEREVNNARFYAERSLRGVPDLVGALDTLGGCQRRLGLHTAALASAQEAVALARGLVESGQPTRTSLEIGTRHIRARPNSRRFTIEPGHPSQVGRPLGGGHRGSPGRCRDAPMPHPAAAATGSDRPAGDRSHPPCHWPSLPACRKPTTSQRTRSTDSATQHGRRTSDNCITTADLPDPAEHSSSRRHCPGQRDDLLRGFRRRVSRTRLPGDVQRVGEQGIERQRGGAGCSGGCQGTSSRLFNAMTW
jgi:hypothetical protein